MFAYAIVTLLALLFAHVHAFPPPASNSSLLAGFPPQFNATQQQEMEPLTWDFKLLDYRGHYAGCFEKQSIALTYDDGPK